MNIEEFLALKCPACLEDYALTPIPRTAEQSIEKGVYYCIVETCRWVGNYSELRQAYIERTRATIVDRLPHSD